MSRRILAVSGVKNSGKTTLIERLIPLLTAAGLSVAVVKHDGHSFEPDVPGTDTRRFLDAGAYGTAVYDGGKFMLTKRESVNAFALADCFPEAELVLIEGLKNEDVPKLRIADGMVTGTFFEETLSRDDIRALADKITAYTEI